MKQHINWMFRPTASPDIMPIEMVFSQWKFKIRRMVLKHEDELVYNVAKQSRNITPEYCRKVCDHCIKEFEKCLNLEDF